jgi:hypothetical protein
MSSGVEIAALKKRLGITFAAAMGNGFRWRGKVFVPRKSDVSRRPGHEDFARATPYRRRFDSVGEAGVAAAFCDFL